LEALAPRSPRIGDERGAQLLVDRNLGTSREVDGGLRTRIANPNVYLVAGYDTRGVTTARIQGLGGGLEKVADYTRFVDIFASIPYYPQVSVGATLQYRILKYEIGLDVIVPKTPLFIEGGSLGDRGNNKSNAPSPRLLHGSVVFRGLGAHFSGLLVRVQGGALQAAPLSGGARS
jgi:hypothetical protein